MASGPLEDDDSREKHRWADSSKVYSRKIHSKGFKNAGNGRADADNNGSVSAAQHSSQTLGTAEDGNLSQLQNLSRFGAASDDSSSLNRPNASMQNALMGVVKVGNRIRIDNLSIRSKSEIREIRRRLVGELDQVRSLFKKIEATEVPVSGYSGVGGVYGHSQVSGNEFTEKDGGALRVHSEVGSVGLHSSRPFRELTVSVMDKSPGVSESIEKDKRTPKANKYYRNSEFLLGKDKFRPPGPPESNKKLRKNGGKVELGSRMDKYMGQVFKSCSNLLTKLMKHKLAWVFNSPVDVKGLGLHDYYTIVRHPMDLGTVKSKLIKKCYKLPREFAEDVRLTFGNAMTYNPKGQDVHYMAEVLSNIFEEKWAAMEAEYNLDCRAREADLATPTSKRTPLQPQHPFGSRNLERSDSMPMPVDPKSKPSHAPMGRAPVLKKPKAKDPQKRDMTYEEKQRLSNNLQKLPSDKLDNIVQIIKKRNSALCQHDDEIEVDIDSVDAETLWELDRFVTNYKKGLSKFKRKAEVALQAREEAAHANQETNSSPVTVEAPKENKTDESTVSTSVQREKLGNDVSRSSSSSSSSSDSESSSSDSDSDSSSACRSDGGHSPKT